MGSSDNDWRGQVFEVRLGQPGHGGFCVARHEGRVLFVRHGLPEELVRAVVTEDRGSFCRADAVEILEASADRVPATCPVSGPGGAGCCDFSFATPQAQRALKASVVAEQLRRLAGWEPEFVVEQIPAIPLGVHRGTPAAHGARAGVPGRVGGVATKLPGTPGAPVPSAAVPADGQSGWRSRMRLVVDAEGRAGVHGYRSTEVITDLRCPQPMAGAMDGIAESKWTPGADLVVAVDGDGIRHLVELAPVQQERDGRRGAGGRRSTSARRAAAAGPRAETVLDGTGRTVQYVGDRRWELSATGFWQPHYGAAQRYSDLVAEWSDAAPGALAWDLYCGVGVFAARLAEQVGPTGMVHGVESARTAVTEGTAALRDLPTVELTAERVERWITEQPSTAPDVVVLDPPRAGAGKEVITALVERTPGRIVHIGCDPASFARDVSLYRAAGYEPSALRVFDAFPGTHHVECVTVLER
ncbi:class I SAM-dependent RNA methyltransferase [Nocardia jejuensis]|uniref:class I SAM-dependent RNA methyltransferase n=1 Tax=Nocardia jejuensis TaxID=328049 RepID=UPI000B2C4537|nr:TRAM domain-containing protein [Nocardia jejuensis]